MWRINVVNDCLYIGNVNGMQDTKYRDVIIKIEDVHQELRANPSYASNARTLLGLSTEK